MSASLPHEDQVTDGWLTAILHAIDNDPRIRSAKSMVKSRVSDVDGAYSAYYPTITGTGSIGDVSNTDPWFATEKRRFSGSRLLSRFPCSAGKRPWFIRQRPRYAWREPS
uniref:Uncharacterized protein n=1 Tax=Candidatus Kentrum sp. UNK TaxID=2126344 RepID=A0A451ANQ9_9GAMM|nr:MAG: hypothetical protein BECKUNK1418G_GA0071005_11547 [Candidatus Kentron sp. UNK]VFK72882.1 MAG: hypothetical protein BECKUNK1418H_GA0071006_11467 [Candidatus Kentron sp. UNK]